MVEFFCVYVFVRVRVYVRAHACARIYAYLHTNMHLYTCPRVCVCAFLYMRLIVCLCTCLYVLVIFFIYLVFVFCKVCNCGNLFVFCGVRCYFVYYYFVDVNSICVCFFLHFIRDFVDIFVTLFWVNSFGVWYRLGVRYGHFMGLHFVLYCFYFYNSL